ncbi:hypothetical protein HFO39_14205 [Rhizobium leguminosarum]|uniref:hypothetical protein n=1 Tax=Rhizobium leguminosarum TaxID=384 RepID=UPI001C96CB80|nr:hypothetical protein [Rhizobium leguminosarum]MBY5635922.1 hypothetical protein [Rhizobium leguminosarum]
MRSLVLLILLFTSAEAHGESDFPFPEPSDTSKAVAPWPGQVIQPPTNGGTVVTSIQTEIHPSFEVNMPASAGTHFQFVTPPVLDTNQVKTCLLQSGADKDEFLGCVVDRALPQEYRMTTECLSNNAGDAARALLCSTGRDDVIAEYDKFNGVSQCVEGSPDNWTASKCVTDVYLEGDARYYADCITQNQGNVTGTIVCGIGKSLTPEQQIAVNCAVASGGEPSTFAACTGGDLTLRELNKCWEHGIGTSQGCLGPNNEYVKFWRDMDDTVKHAFGENSEVYRAFSLVRNNVLSPGPNHEGIKAINNALNDIKNGPSENNEAVKAIRGLQDGLQSIGNVLSF